MHHESPAAAPHESVEAGRFVGQSREADGGDREAAHGDEECFRQAER